MDFQKIFSDALSEEGVDAEVSHQRTRARAADRFVVEKMINGKKEKTQVTVAFPEKMSDEEIRQRLAIEAGNVARAFDEHLTELRTWDGRAVLFDGKGRYSASCCSCDAKVTVDDLRHKSQNLKMAEASVPNPTPPDFEKLPTQKLQMALHAVLQWECDEFCPNHRKV